MRHEFIHDMQCECTRCETVHARPIPDADLNALRKGAIAALYVGGFLAARELGPSILDWVVR